MQHRYFFYIAKNYARNMLLLLFGITLAVVLIDYLKQSTYITDLGNQMILYLFYMWEFRISQFYPLAIVFAAVITYMSFVRSNILVSFLSLGYTRKQLFIPFIFPAFILYIVIIMLQTGEFSYAKERAKAILSHTKNTRVVNDLFFKYDDTFVYVKKLDPIKKVLQEVTIFNLKNKVVESTVILDSALYSGVNWVAKRAVLIQKQYEKEKGTLKGFSKKQMKNYQFLRGYKPKVIELIYEGKSLTLIDAINTYRVLKDQHLNTDKIKASFYSKIVLPLFSFAMMVILFFKSSYHARYMNRELVLALALGGTLVIWGGLYALYSLSISGTVSPDLAMVLPVILLLFYAFYLYIDGGEKLA